MLQSSTTPKIKLGWKPTTINIRDKKIAVTLSVSTIASLAGGVVGHIIILKELEKNPEFAGDLVRGLVSNGLTGGIFGDILESFATSAPFSISHLGGLLVTVVCNSFFCGVFGAYEPKDAMIRADSASTSRLTIPVGMILSSAYATAGCSVKVLGAVFDTVIGAIDGDGMIESGDALLELAVVSATISGELQGKLAKSATGSEHIGQMGGVYVPKNGPLRDILALVAAIGITSANPNFLNEQIGDAVSNTIGSNIGYFVGGMFTEMLLENTKNFIVFAQIIGLVVFAKTSLSGIESVIFTKSSDHTAVVGGATPLLVSSTTTTNTTSEEKKEHLIVRSLRLIPVIPAIFAPVILLLSIVNFITLKLLEPGLKPIIEGLSRFASGHKAEETPNNV